jgi:hypothetical protein
MTLTEEQWSFVGTVLLVLTIVGPIWAIKWFFTGRKKK